MHVPAAPVAPSRVPKRKVIAQFTANVLAFAMSWLVTKLGAHEPAALAAEVSALIGVASGVIAGYAVREAAVIERDLGEHP